MTERFFRSNRPGYPHPVSSELENSGIRVAVGGCSVTERQRWHPPYQIGNTVHVHAKHYKHNEDGCTVCVWQWFGTAEPLGERRYENWNTHTHYAFSQNSEKNPVIQLIKRQEREMATWTIFCQKWSATFVYNATLATRPIRRFPIKNSII